ATSTVEPDDVAVAAKRACLRAGPKNGDSIFHPGSIVLDDVLPDLGCPAEGAEDAPALVVVHAGARDCCHAVVDLHPPVRCTGELAVENDILGGSSARSLPCAVVHADRVATCRTQDDGLFDLVAACLGARDCDGVDLRSTGFAAVRRDYRSLAAVEDDPAKDVVAACDPEHGELALADRPYDGTRARIPVEAVDHDLRA